MKRKRKGRRCEREEMMMLRSCEGEKREIEEKGPGMRRRMRRRTKKHRNNDGMVE